MKRGVGASAAALVVVAWLLGCCGASQGGTCKRPTPRDQDVMTQEEQQAWCTRAGAHLAELSCKEARPDFASFCMYEMGQGVPIQPTCLSSIQACPEVEACK